MQQHSDHLLAEYQAAHASFHHYDTFRWQSGAALLAACMVVWGLLITTNKGSELIGLTSLLMALLLSAWLLYAHHYRQMYMCKLHRIHEIEKELGMALNLRHGFPGIATPYYRKFGPKGHHLDCFVFVIVVLFGPVLGFLTLGFSWWLCISLPILAGTIVWVSLNECRMVRFYALKVTRDQPARK